MMIRTIAAFLALLVALAPPLAARSPADMVTVRILPGWQDADGTHMAALQFSLAEGWKTYWRAPGDAGIPPRIDWRGSGNLDAVDIVWPTPQQTVTSGMRTIGYERDLVLPLRLTPRRADRAVSLEARIEIGICKDICVPVDMTVAAQLPPGGDERDPRIAAALAARPYTAQEAGVGRVACTMTPLEGGGLRLVAEIDMKPMGAREWVVVETDTEDLWVSQSDTTRHGDRLRAVTEVHHVERQGFMIDRSGLRLTVLSTGDAVEIEGCPGG
ncbi:protein-disulfide reductase DsbD domain-containing protein [Roseovarius sp. D22-M7]|uniref:protein-disulfide reductase DsbD domain-containing protein n=1 Tax=Roseovarius sp. D22-M7 TaxID=3127116 RepID=UPI00300FFB23